MATNNAINWNKPLPLFKCYPSAALLNVTGDNSEYTVVFNTKAFDYGSNISATGVFTVPKTARYYLSTQCTYGQLSAAYTDGYIQIVDTTVLANINVFLFAPRYILNASNIGTASLSCITSLTAGHQISIFTRIAGSTKTVDISAGESAAYFEGYLINE